MRVGMLTTSYPRHGGDYRGVFVKRLEESLQQAGVTVDVIEPRGYDVLKKGSGLLGNLKTSLAAKLVFPVYCIHFMVLAVVMSRQVELLHANWSLSGFFAVIASRLTRRKLLLTERSPLLIETNNVWLNRFTGWVMRRTDRLVTISTSARKSLQDKFAGLEFVVIPNGVDEERFKPAPNSRMAEAPGVDSGQLNVLTVGRLTPIKRLDTLLAGIAGVVREGIDVKLWIIGDGELREGLERLVSSDPSLEGRVVFLGQRPQHEVALWMQRGDVFVLSSAGESGGNVVLEAMSTGLAVISTPVGWAVDYIEHGTNGLLSPIGDSAALERSIERLARDPGFRRRLGERARETIFDRRLTWRGCAELYIEEYRGLLEAGRS